MEQDAQRHKSARSTSGTNAHGEQEEQGRRSGTAGIFSFETTWPISPSRFFCVLIPDTGTE